MLPPEPQPKQPEGEKEKSRRAGRDRGGDGASQPEGQLGNRPDSAQVDGSRPDDVGGDAVMGPDGWLEYCQRHPEDRDCG